LRHRGEFDPGFRAQSALNPGYVASILSYALRSLS
jgi:hypothetical protein